MVLTERDKVIISTIAKFRFLLGKQIRLLCGFNGQRSTDRRLSKLLENEFVERKRILYGLAGLYTITEKARKQFFIELSNSKIRIEQIEHDIFVVNTAIYFLRKESLTLEDIKTEKELKHLKGFAIREHEPDFVFSKSNETNCVEIETSLKAKSRLLKNLKDNFQKYDTQFWIIPDEQQKIFDIVHKSTKQFPNIEIIKLSEIEQFISKL